ncbi:MAG: glycoside hydrolase family 29 [Acidobacteria bacterium]|nr:MAG: glycoside hydrolase family 29 [Acidobacteriota bacterium]
MSRVRTCLHPLLATALTCGVVLGSSRAPDSISPVGAVPTPRQLAWHDLQFYGFIHFTVNTFTDKEWGYGDEPESVFNPTALDARQWAQVARDAGMKGLIITAKHHDGFCLWPSRFTTHSVKGSPWKNGRGDVVGELARACREYGLTFGVYLSPWDRNHAEYGRPAYLEYYRGQLRELLSDYGPLFEVWFDGANGGDGYYGGARERRRIDGATYYDWPNTWEIVRERQPHTVMFSDAGPDVRWVGNEKGVAFETSWNPLNRAGLFPGAPNYAAVAAGTPDGTDWVPPEVDVSIRPGWFYHAAEDGDVKSVDKLVEIYEQSVGRGANLLLNIPPDRRGLIPDVDVARLREFGARIHETYKKDLARDATARGAEERGGSPSFPASLVTDGDATTYWAAEEGATRGTIELEWKRPVRFDRVVLQEAIALGQRVQAWTIDAHADGRWKRIAEGTTIGYKRIARAEAMTTTRLRVTIEKARARPVISTVSVYLSPLS